MAQLVERLTLDFGQVMSHDPRVLGWSSDGAYLGFSLFLSLSFSLSLLLPSSVPPLLHAFSLSLSLSLSPSQIEKNA